MLEDEPRNAGRRKVTSWDMYRKLKHKVRSLTDVASADDNRVENW